ncbi:MAG: AEC family transporter [Sphingobium sp.]
MLTTIATILPVFLIILVGYGAARSGVLPTDSAQVLNRFVIWIPLPCLMFHIVATTDWVRQWDTGFVIASVGASMAVFGLGMCVGRWRGLSLADMAVDGLNASYANTAYIGLPLLTLVLGPASRPYVVVAASLTLMLLFASAVILIEMARHKANGFAYASGQAVKGTIRNPVVVAPLLGLLWWLSGIKLPVPLDNMLDMVGGSASPTALLAIGLFLAQRPLLGAITNPFVVSLSAIKLVVHPALTAVIALYMLHLPRPVAAAAIMVAAMPTGTGPFMVTGFYARDGAVTSGTILLSTIVSILTIAAILTLLVG